MLGQLYIKGMAEMNEADLPDFLANIPPITEGNTYYQEHLSGYLVNKESVLDITEVDLAYLLDDMERVGKKFRGNKNKAIALLQQGIFGMLIPITEQLTDEQIKNAKFGLYWSEKSEEKAGALFNPQIKEYGKRSSHKAMMMEVEFLEDLCQRDLHEVIEIRTPNGEVAVKAPPWAVIRWMLMEEGAHYAYTILNPNYLNADEKMSLAEYRAMPIEYDALLWMRADAKLLKENPLLASRDREGISQAEEIFDITYRQAREVRRQKAEAKKSRKHGGLHPFGI